MSALTSRAVAVAVGIGSLGAIHMQVLVTLITLAGRIFTTVFITPACGILATILGRSSACRGLIALEVTTLAIVAFMAGTTL